MSEDTPRTDAALECGGDNPYNVAADLARELERELAEFKHNAFRDIGQLTKQRDNAIADLENSRKDSERLDWMVENDCKVIFVQSINKWRCCRNVYGPNPPIDLIMRSVCGEGDTPRQAIDAAMQEDGQ